MNYLELLKQQLQQNGQLKLNVKVTPSAPRSEIFDQLANGTLKVRLQAPPENGKANKALIKLFKHQLNADATIQTGHASPQKRVYLQLLPTPPA